MEGRRGHRGLVHVWNCQELLVHGKHEALLVCNGILRFTGLFIAVTKKKKIRAIGTIDGTKLLKQKS